MAVRPCADSVRCPGTDSPIENYSSEAPDDLRFIGLSFDPYGGHWHDPNGNYKAEGCLGVCYSTISQEDADFCAALQAYLCNQDDCDPADPNCEYHCPGDPRCSCTANDPDPNCHIHCPGDPRCNPDCPPDDPNCPYDCPGDPRCAVPVVYYNVEQTCHLTCPDGSSFAWIVPARKFAADSQVLADRMAASWCKQQANFHLVCLSNIPNTATVGVPYKNPNGSTVRIQATGATVVTGKDVWTLVSGVIPPGLTLHLNQEVSGGIALDGVPTVFGVYSFTVKVTTPSGDFMVKTYTITVSGLYNDMGMDQAVYHPTRGTVFGVRGAYLFEFQAGSSTLLANRTRFCKVSMGMSSIAYDAASDKLFVASWYDPIGTGTTPLTINGLYKINPATLAVESFIDATTWHGFSDNFDQGAGDWNNANFQMIRIIASGGKIYGVLPAGPFVYDPNTNTGIVQTFLFVGEWCDLAINGTELWVPRPDAQQFHTFDTLGAHLNPITQTSTGSPDYWGIAVNPGNNQAFFCHRTDHVHWWKPDNTLGGLIVLPSATATPFCLRYNPFDGMIYVPGYGSNEIYVIDPSTYAVVATKTGGGTVYDLPLDCVFTPTKTYVVQQGVVGLRELT